MGRDGSAPTQQGNTITVGPRSPEFVESSTEVRPFGSTEIRSMLLFVPMSAEDAQEVSRVLVACRALELAMADFYEGLADVHSHVPSMVRLWKKTAREEANHAAQFNLALEAMTEVIARPLVAPAELETIQKAIESMAEEHRRRPPSVHEALTTAIELETSMSDLHADRILVFTDPRCRLLFQAMMAADAGHVASLRAALAELPAT
jgi:rubrerythrin